MKFLIKKIYFSIFLLVLALSNSIVLAKNNDIEYNKENISNYFLGIVSVKENYNNKAFKHLNKIQEIKNIHSNYNIEFIRTLVTLEKFEKAVNFSNKVWDKNELFFEADLLLGLNFFLKKDYSKAEKHFERLNKISRYNLIFDNFVGNVLLSWNTAIQNKKEESFRYINKIPDPYHHLKQTQDIFLQCYFNLDSTEDSFIKLINNKEYDFSRYNFFLANYLLSKEKKKEAQKVIKKATTKYSSNLLLQQAELFLKNNKISKITDFFNCKDPKESLAEFFYVIANLYSSEKNYRLSNFYLKISLLLNEKFISNKTLLAENFYYQEKYKNSKNVYFSLKPLGEIYSWHASKNIATILIDEKGKKYSIKFLEDDFNLLVKPNFKHYYDLANFYKDNEYFKKSIEYYSHSLNQINRDHSLVPKLLDRRGTSYEKIDDWKNAEKDLMESLEIKPEQAHVLNYLAYSWIDKGINLDKGLVMLKKAAKLKENDGYIIDSLGWAHYAKNNYNEANMFLQKAVELLPSDPVINDHYADSLWMLNKNIQARYIWGNILKLDEAKVKLKKNIKKKIIFGITR
jgi:tetratricopeptide (TPR) repeat protein